jgi:hypothetical protein
VIFPTRIIKTSTVLTALDAVVLVDASAGAVTVTLPPVQARIGLRYYIKKTDTSANAVTIATHAAETIDDCASIEINMQYDCAEVISDDVEWWII